MEQLRAPWGRQGDRRCTARSRLAAQTSWTASSVFPAAEAAGRCLAGDGAVPEKAIHRGFLHRPLSTGVLLHAMAAMCEPFSAVSSKVPHTISNLMWLATASVFLSATIIAYTRFSGWRWLVGYLVGWLVIWVSVWLERKTRITPWRRDRPTLGAKQSRQPQRHVGIVLAGRRCRRRGGGRGAGSHGGLWWRASHPPVAVPHVAVPLSQGGRGGGRQCTARSRMAALTR
jgi:hypothetical protein